MILTSLIAEILSILYRATEKILLRLLGSKLYTAMLRVKTLLIKQDTGKQGAQLRMDIWWAFQRGYKGVVTIDGNNKDSRAYPKTGKVPTKISFFKDNSELMKILLKNIIGAYNPQ